MRANLGSNLLEPINSRFANRRKSFTNSPESMTMTLWQKLVTEAATGDETPLNTRPVLHGDDRRSIKWVFFSKYSQYYCT